MSRPASRKSTRLAYASIPRSFAAGRDVEQLELVARFCEEIAKGASILVAVGSFEGASAASLGLVGFVGSAWQSLRGGTIDSLVRLNLALSPRAEGGAVVDSRGRVILPDVEREDFEAEHATRRLNLA